MWYPCNGVFSAIKMNEVLIYATMRIKHKNIMLSKRSQTHKKSRTI